MRLGMFLGVETYNWNEQQLTSAILQQKSLGIDTVLLKIADGKNTWYGADLGPLLTRLNKLINIIPYQYVYGDTYGGIDREIQITNWLIDLGFVPCLDMEIEYNGRTDWCQKLIDTIKGRFWVSTWADPALQNWNQNLAILNKKVDLFFPQVYTPYLQSIWQEQYQQAGVNISKCIPTITTATLGVASGRTSITMWEMLTFNKPLILEIQKEMIPMATTPVDLGPKKAQALAVWNANTLDIGTGTGIYGVWMDKFVNESLDAGPPITKEIHTFDWSGVTIVKQFFAQGVSIEWYTESKNGHTIGENHAYTLKSKLW